MDPAFIYFREIPVRDNKKFTLDFSDKEFVQKINFNKKKKDYYIASLNCSLILKEDNKKKKEKIIEELSEKVGFYSKKALLIKMILAG